MMTAFVLTALWTAKPISAFVSNSRFASSRLYATSTGSVVDTCVSRLSTLQELLRSYGAPGSTTCTLKVDLVPVESGPELLSAMEGSDVSNLHPYLFPIARSAASSDSFICAYRNPALEEANKSHPWPIVETTLGGHGMKLLALNSEHLMRRIVCECDASDSNTELIDVYNDGLGKGKLSDSLLDAPYQRGEVQKLGYGVEKYVLLRVGPFADLYQQMSKEHAAKGDEQSSLIAAETCNNKLSGFGSNYVNYAQLLSSLPHRKEEARDAARMSLRLPLATIGLSMEDMKRVTVLADVAKDTDSVDDALLGLGELFDKMREVEHGDNPNEEKHPEQIAMDDALYLLDRTLLDRKDYVSIRPKLARIYEGIGWHDIANFVSLRT